MVSARGYLPPHAVTTPSGSDVPPLSLQANKQPPNSGRSGGQDSVRSNSIPFAQKSSARSYGSGTPAHHGGTPAHQPVAYSGAHPNLPSDLRGLETEMLGGQGGGGSRKG